MENLNEHSWDNEEDGWCGIAEEQREFLLKSSYKKLERLLILEDN
jgi:hypothetical protein